jgi:hypothetical protein
MSETLTIPARFNGPPESANGGYTCGLVAELVGAEVASVSLRVPPPLEHRLAVVRDGARVELRDGETVVAEGAPAELLLDVPDAVTPAEAAAASEAGSEHWSTHHPFPSCIVCGPERAPGDGLRVFPGRVDDGLFAAEWTPDESLDDGSGRVRPECVWAALDCPTSAPVANFAEGPPMVLARLTARLGGGVRVGEPHALLAWPLDPDGERLRGGARPDGRKHHAACALFDSERRLLCASRALWIELRRPRERAPA